jgi:hypothetical protein
MIATRRAVVAFASVAFGPASVVALARHHRPVGALVLGGLLVCYWVAEWVAWEVRHSIRARADRTAEHRTAGPLLDVVETREYDGRPA